MGLWGEVVVFKGKDKGEERKEGGKKEAVETTVEFTLGAGGSK